ncbi:MAG: dihydropteroate synthase [Deltaproteobacteria bacterium]|jgi:dihydropteroate synthase|nr:dihydropteroate synthase [Deltaproteobacteria bacterium]
MSGTTILPPERVTIVGVLNATPDSFSDGGRFVSGEEELRLDRAVSAARTMVEAGAHWIDVGGESTRPGAAPVSAAAEIARTRPIVEALTKELEAPISIDTRKAAVAEAALDAGASIVNDVAGLADPELASVVAARRAGLVIGHLRGVPATMQRDVAFGDVLGEVSAELALAAERAQAAGVPAERIAVDPGIGFGKELEHNLTLLARIGEIREATGFPVLVGASRKSFLGTLTGDPVAERDLVSHAACAVAVFAGADAVRVHDVAGARRAVQVASALRSARGVRP